MDEMWLDGGGKIDENKTESFDSSLCAALRTQGIALQNEPHCLQIYKMLCNFQNV